MGHDDNTDKGGKEKSEGGGEATMDNIEKHLALFILKPASCILQKVKFPGEN